jgi:short-subunit dehydrogenase
MIIGVFHPPMRPGSFGGSVAVTVPMANALAEDGYDVVLFVRDKVDQQKLLNIMGQALSNRIKIILKPSKNHK